MPFCKGFIVGMSSRRFHPVVVIIRARSSLACAPGIRSPKVTHAFGHPAGMTRLRTPEVLSSSPSAAVFRMAGMGSSVKLTVRFWRIKVCSRGSLSLIPWRNGLVQTEQKFRDALVAAGSSADAAPSMFSERPEMSGALKAPVILTKMRVRARTGWRLRTGRHLNVLYGPGASL